MTTVTLLLFTILCTSHHNLQKEFCSPLLTDCNQVNHSCYGSCPVSSPTTVSSVIRATIVAASLQFMVHLSLMSLVSLGHHLAMVLSIRVVGYGLQAASPPCWVKIGATTKARIKVLSPCALKICYTHYKTRCSTVCTYNVSRYQQETFDAFFLC